MRLYEARLRAPETYPIEAYNRANHFIRVILRDNSDRLTQQQIKTLRGQALKGDIEGAYRGLAKITGRAEDD